MNNESNKAYLLENTISTTHLSGNEKFITQCNECLLEKSMGLAVEYLSQVYLYLYSGFT